MSMSIEGVYSTYKYIYIHTVYTYDEYATDYEGVCSSYTNTYIRTHSVYVYTYDEYATDNEGVCATIANCWFLPPSGQLPAQHIHHNQINHKNK